MAEEDAYTRVLRLQGHLGDPMWVPEIQSPAGMLGPSYWGKGGGLGDDEGGGARWSLDSWSPRRLRAPGTWEWNKHQYDIEKYGLPNFPDVGLQEWAEGKQRAFPSQAHLYEGGTSGMVGAFGKNLIGGLEKMLGGLGLTSSVEQISDVTVAGVYNAIEDPLAPMGSGLVEGVKDIYSGQTRSQDPAIQAWQDPISGTASALPAMAVEMLLPMSTATRLARGAGAVPGITRTTGGQVLPGMFQTPQMALTASKYRAAGAVGTGLAMGLDTYKSTDSPLAGVISGGLGSMIQPLFRGGGQIGLGLAKAQPINRALAATGLAKRKASSTVIDLTKANSLSQLEKQMLAQNMTGRYLANSGKQRMAEYSAGQLAAAGAFEAGHAAGQVIEDGWRGEDGYWYNSPYNFWGEKNPEVRFGPHFASLVVGQLPFLAADLPVLYKSRPTVKAEKVLEQHHFDRNAEVKRWLDLVYKSEATTPWLSAKSGHDIPSLSSISKTKPLVVQPKTLQRAPIDKVFRTALHAEAGARMDQIKNDPNISPERKAHLLKIISDNQIRLHHELPSRPTNQLNKTLFRELLVAPEQSDASPGAHTLWAKRVDLLSEFLNKNPTDIIVAHEHLNVSNALLSEAGIKPITDADLAPQVRARIEQGETVTEAVTAEVQVGKNRANSATEVHHQPYHDSWVKPVPEDVAEAQRVFAKDQREQAAFEHEISQAGVHTMTPAESAAFYAKNPQLKWRKDFIDRKRKGQGSVRPEIASDNRQRGKNMRFLKQFNGEQSPRLVERGAQKAVDDHSVLYEHPPMAPGDESPAPPQKVTASSIEVLTISNDLTPGEQALGYKYKLLVKSKGKEPTRLLYYKGKFNEHYQKNALTESGELLFLESRIRADDPLREMRLAANPAKSTKTNPAQPKDGKPVVHAEVRSNEAGIAPLIVESSDQPVSSALIGHTGRNTESILLQGEKGDTPSEGLVSIKEWAKQARAGKLPGQKGKVSPTGAPKQVPAHMAKLGADLVKAREEVAQADPPTSSMLTRVRNLEKKLGEELKKLEEGTVDFSNRELETQVTFNELVEQIDSGVSMLTPQQRQIRTEGLAAYRTFMDFAQKKMAFSTHLDQAAQALFVKWAKTSLAPGATEAHASVVNLKGALNRLARQKEGGDQLKSQVRKGGISDTKGTVTKYKTIEEVTAEVDRLTDAHPEYTFKERFYRDEGHYVINKISYIDTVAIDSPQMLATAKAVAEVHNPQSAESRAAKQGIEDILNERITKVRDNAGLLDEFITHWPFNPKTRRAPDPITTLERVRVYLQEAADTPSDLWHIDSTTGERYLNKNVLNAINKSLPAEFQFKGKEGKTPAQVMREFYGGKNAARLEEVTRWFLKLEDLPSDAHKLEKKGRPDFRLAFPIDKIAPGENIGSKKFKLIVDADGFVPAARFNKWMAGQNLPKGERELIMAHIVPGDVNINLVELANTLSALESGLFKPRVDYGSGAKGKGHAVSTIQSTAHELENFSGTEGFTYKHDFLDMDAESFTMQHSGKDTIAIDVIRAEWDSEPLSVKVHLEVPVEAESPVMVPAHTTLEAMGWEVTKVARPGKKPLLPDTVLQQQYIDFEGWREKEPLTGGRTRYTKTFDSESSVADRADVAGNIRTGMEAATRPLPKYTREGGADAPMFVADKMTTLFKHIMNHEFGEATDFASPKEISSDQYADTNPRPPHEMTEYGTALLQDNTTGPHINHGDHGSPKHALNSMAHARFETVGKTKEAPLKDANTGEDLGVATFNYENQSDPVRNNKKTEEWLQEFQQNNAVPSTGGDSQGATWPTIAGIWKKIQRTPEGFEHAHPENRRYFTEGKGAEPATLDTSTDVWFVPTGNAEIAIAVIQRAETGSIELKTLNADLTDGENAYYNRNPQSLKDMKRDVLQGYDLPLVGVSSERYITNPLLHQNIIESLQAKLVIKEAKAKGHDGVVFTDAATSMMTQQHDQLPPTVHDQHTVAEINEVFAHPKLKKKYIMRLKTYTGDPDGDFIATHTGAQTIEVYAKNNLTQKLATFSQEALTPTDAIGDATWSIPHNALGGGEQTARFLRAFEGVLKHKAPKTSKGQLAAYASGTHERGGEKQKRGRGHDIYLKLTGAKEGVPAYMGEHQNALHEGSMRGFKADDSIYGSPFFKEVYTRANPAGHESGQGQPKSSITGMFYRFPKEDVEAQRQLFMRRAGTSTNVKVNPVPQPLTQGIASFLLSTGRRLGLKDAELHSHIATGISLATMYPKVAEGMRHQEITQGALQGAFHPGRNMVYTNVEAMVKTGDPLLGRYLISHEIGHGWLEAHRNGRLDSAESKRVDDFYQAISDVAPSQNQMVLQEAAQLLPEKMRKSILSEIHQSDGSYDNPNETMAHLTGILSLAMTTPKTKAKFRDFLVHMPMQISDGVRSLMRFIVNGTRLLKEYGRWSDKGLSGSKLDPRLRKGLNDVNAQLKSLSKINRELDHAEAQLLSMDSLTGEGAWARMSQVSKTSAPAELVAHEGIPLELKEAFLMARKVTGLDPAVEAKKHARARKKGDKQMATELGHLSPDEQILRYMSLYLEPAHQLAARHEHLADLIHLAGDVVVMSKEGQARIHAAGLGAKHVDGEFIDTDNFKHLAPVVREKGPAKDLFNEIAQWQNKEGDGVVWHRDMEQPGGRHLKQKLDTLSPTHRDAVLGALEGMTRMHAFLTGQQIRARIEKNQAWIASAIMEHMNRDGRRMEPRQAFSNAKAMWDAAVILSNPRESLTQHQVELAGGLQAQLAKDLPPDLIAKAMQTAVEASAKHRGFIERKIAKPGHMSEVRYGKHGIRFKKNGKSGMVTGNTPASAREKLAQVTKGKWDKGTMEKVEMGEKQHQKITREVLDHIVHSEIKNQSDLNARLEQLGARDLVGDLSDYFDAGSKVRREMLARDVALPGIKRKYAWGRESLDMWQTQLDHFNIAVKNEALSIMEARESVHMQDPAVVADPKHKAQVQLMLNNFRFPDTQMGTNLTKGVFTYFLGWNFSSSTLEGFQSAFSLVPNLTADGAGYIGSYKLVGSAIKKVGAYHMVRPVKGAAKRAIGAKPKHEAEYGSYGDPDADMAMKHFHDTQQVDNLGSAQEIIDGETLINSHELNVPKEHRTNMGKYAGTAAGAFHGSGVRMYKVMTNFNARVALLAGFNHYRGKILQGQRLRPLTPTEMETVLEQTRRLNLVVNMSGGKTSRPAAFFANKGRYSRTASQALWSLQSYNAGMVATYGRFIEKGFTRRHKNLTAEQRRNYRKATYQLLATQLFAAGVVGLPFVGQSLGVLKQMGWDGQTWIRNKTGGIAGMMTDDEKSAGLITDMAMYGVMNELLPMDMGSRFSLGGVMGVSPYEGLNATTLGGPSLKLVTEEGKALNELVQGLAQGNLGGLEGRGLKAVQHAVPQGFKNTIKLIRNRGKVLSASDKLYKENMSLGETAAHALGFVPNDVSRLRQIDSAEQHISESIQAEEQIAIKQFGELYKDGNYHGLKMAVHERARNNPGWSLEVGAEAIVRYVDKSTIAMDPRNMSNRGSREGMSELLKLHRNIPSPSGVRSQYLREHVLGILGIPGMGDPDNKRLNKATLEDIYQLRSPREDRGDLRERLRR